MFVELMGVFLIGFGVGCLVSVVTFILSERQLRNPSDELGYLYGFDKEAKIHFKELSKKVGQPGGPSAVRLSHVSPGLWYLKVDYKYEGIENHA